MKQTTATYRCACAWRRQKSAQAASAWRGGAVCGIATPRAEKCGRREILVATSDERQIDNSNGAVAAAAISGDAGCADMAATRGLSDDGLPSKEAKKIAYKSANKHCAGWAQKNDTHRVCIKCARFMALRRVRRTCCAPSRLDKRQPRILARQYPRAFASFSCCVRGVLLGTVSNAHVRNMRRACAARDVHLIRPYVATCACIAACRRLRGNMKSSAKRQYVAINIK